MHIEDRLTNAEERLSRMEARVSALEPGGEPEPAPHPLAGLEYCWTNTPTSVWHTSELFPGPSWLEDGDDYTKPAAWRDSITKAPVPLWQVAKRLGVEHPVPDAVRWTDVEFTGKADGDCTPVTRWWKKHDWTDEDSCDPNFFYRLSAQYDHQEISYAQFREILGRGEPEAVLYREDVECGLDTLPGEYEWGLKSIDAPSEHWLKPHRDPAWQFRNRHTQQPITREQFVQAIRNSEEREAKVKPASEVECNGPKPATIFGTGTITFHTTGATVVAENFKLNTDFRVGDLVEVVDVSEGFDAWFGLGERFVVKTIRTNGSPQNSAGMGITPCRLRLISRPNP